MNTTEKFSGLAKDYTIGRPTYAESFIDYLYECCGFSERTVIADIGSGTGKFAKQLLSKGSKVICVEPNDDMRNTAIDELSCFEKFHAVKGTSDDTTLEGFSVDVITVAQAFHWFDVEAFQRECKRILKNDGMVFLIWNMRDMDREINQKCHDIYKKYCPNFKGFGGGIQKDDIRIKRFFNDKYRCLEFDNPLYYDQRTFISRCLSGSYSLQEGDERFEEYLTELNSLFEKYSEEKYIKMDNKTVVYLGTCGE